jgi:plasmid stabilization system protein ParE
MSRYQFTNKAAGDLYDIWSFIAENNLEAADRVVEAIFRACELLADSPFAGRLRGELTTLQVRFWVVQPYRKYFIVYDPNKKPLEIIRILHGARNIASILI